MRLTIDVETGKITNTQAELAEYIKARETARYAEMNNEELMFEAKVLELNRHNEYKTVGKPNPSARLYKYFGEYLEVENNPFSEDELFVEEDPEAVNDLTVVEFLNNFHHCQKAMSFIKEHTAFYE